jgi:hypothetical protein
MKASQIVAFITNVINEHGDINVNAQTDPSSGTSEVTGFWTRVIPETGERVLIVCHKNAQTAATQI